MPSNSARGPLFVVGVWRSGTSLLYALLNKHPQIALMYEGDLHLLWPLFWMPGVRSRWPARWDFFNSALKRHQIDSHSIPTGLTNVKAASEAIYLEYARGRKATIWGEKSPNYFDSLTRIARAFPNARFIVILRDPGDICRSIIKAAKTGSYFRRRGITLRALLGSERMKVQCQRLLGKGIPVHQIQYEKLIRDPAGSMMRVCEFLGIPFDPGMTSLGGADRTALYEGEHHALVKGDTIVPSPERAEVLSPQFKRKIQRYTLFWKERYGGECPVPPQVLGSQASKPTLAERLFDRALYRLLRSYDFAEFLIYCFAPLRLNRTIRSLKARNAVKTKQPRVVSRREEV